MRAARNGSRLKGSETIYAFNSMPADGKASRNAKPSNMKKLLGLIALLGHQKLGVAIAAKVKEILK